MRYNKTVQELIKKNAYGENKDVYVIALIDGEGHHIGRIKDILLDSNNDIVVEIDIDNKSVTGWSTED